jgi:uncharacterized lipoprotein
MRTMLSIRVVVILLLTVVLAACGIFSNSKEFAYFNAKMSSPLQMPEGLSVPQGNQPVFLPQVQVDTIDLTNDLVEPPQIVRSVDLTELDAEQKTQEAEPQQPEPTRVALLSKQTRTPEGDSVLLVDAEFETVWPLVAPALKELGFTIDDSSRGAQVYTISKELATVNIDPVHPGDEKPAVKQEYQIHMKQVGEKTQIAVHNKYGELEASGISDHLLLQIGEILANPEETPDNG